MNNPVDTTAPYLCTQETDLIPFFQSCVDKSKKLGNNVFSSITFETNYCDPLAILEQFYRRNSLFSFYEKPSEEFSVACGTPITIAKFNDAERFTKAKRWSKELFKKTFIAGNHLTECTGPTLFLNATFEDNSSDKKIEIDDITLLVDPKSYLYLMGTEIDYVDGLSGKGFKFTNPNAKRTCGCGESFSV